MADKFDATIITGSLDGKELENSIDALVKNVSDKTEKMADGFVQSIDKMKLAMKSFALTQKVSVDLMKEAWRNMSSSFDAMVAAQTNATSGGSGKGGSKASGASITELRNNIGVVEAQIQKFEAARQKFISIRDEIEKTARSLSANKKDLALIQKGANVYEFDDFGNKVTVTAEKAKKRIKDLEESLRRLMSERVTIPAPSGEELRKYEELQRKLVQLKDSLNKAQTPETVGDLKKQISSEQQYQNSIRLGTQELREQNQLIADQKQQLKEELMTEEEKRKAIEKQNEALERQKAKQLKKDQAPYLENWNTARKMSDVQLADAEKKLQALRREQEKMQKSGLFNQAKLNEAQQAIDRLREKIEQLRSRKPKTMAEVLGMDEKSIDDIAKKMRELKRVQIDPNNVSQAKQLGDEYSRLKRRLAELQGQNIQATHSNNYLAQSFGYIRNRVVCALTLGAMMQFVKNVYEIRSQYELLERSLGVLVNSFENGSRIFQELNNMALESPFTTMELAGAAKQLTAYNFAAKEVVDTTRRLADISSALGVPMERLTYNLGQIRAQTVLTARDARDFANAGLPIVASLAEHFSELEGRVVTTGDVYNRMSKKMVSYNDVMSVLNKMTDEGGKFFEFQAKQAETLKVQINNLDLATNNFFNEFGKANQSLLAAPIQGLKLLLQNWKSIDRVLQSIAVTFGVWKLAQVVAIKQQWAWASACGATAKQMGSVASAFASVGKALKALALNPWTWLFVGIMAVTDLINQFRQAKQAMHELNEEIRNNAKEASDSNLKFLDNKGNQSAYNLAKQNKLTAIDGERAWAKNKEQIEQSAMSANSLVAELSAIPDINERVAKSFEYISSIQQAQAALQDLKDDTIKVSTDAGWFGMFGEGLVSDLKDFAQSIETTTSIIKNRDWWSDAQKQNALTNILGVGDVKTQRQEFLDELENTAQSINSFIVAHNITDPLQINEIYKRAVVTIKTKNPEIKGELARLFDFELDKRMSQLTKGAIDENASLWDMFMERLKHNSSGAFQDINDDWANSNKKLSTEQKKAIDDNLKYFKDSMPEAYNAVAKMVADASKLRIRIGLTFSKGSLTDFQKEVNKRISNASNKLDFGSDSLKPNSNEILHSWAKRMQDDIAAYKEENVNYQRDVDALEKKDKEKNKEKIAWSKQHIADNDKQIQQRKNLLDLFNQQYEKEKKGRKGSQKDLVLEALKNEIDLIKKAQSEYEKLTKDGASANDALATLNGAFGKTVTLLNSRLASYGLPLLDLKNVVKGNPKETLAFLEKISKALTDRGLSNLERMKVVEVVIEEFKLKAKSFDLKQITEGLKRELDKRKDEYELALMLDNNPETRDIFADFMQIDKKTLAELPRSYSQLVSKLQESVNKLFKENDVTAEFDLSKMINKDNFEKWVKDNGHTIDDAMAKSLESIRNYLTNLLNEETKQLGELVSKYGEAHAKIEKIYAKSTRSVLSVISTYGDENEKAQGLNLANQISLSDDTATIARLRNELNTLATKVADKSDAAQNLLDAIFKNTKENVAKTLWEGFKGGDYYSIIFDDLSRASTAALQGMKAQLDGLKDQIKESPESMKAFMSAYSKLRTELIERDPFKGIADGLNNMRIAHQQVIIAMAELDAANQNVEKKEHALNELRKKEPNNIVKIYQAEKELAKAKKNVADKTAKVVKAQNDETASQNDYKKAIKEANTVIKKLADSLKEIGETLDNTTGNVIKFIGDILNFVTFVSDSMTTVSQNASRAIQTIEKASVILAIISAAIQLIQELNSLIPDSFDQYEKAAKKQAEINKLTDAIVQYQLAVLAARMEEENWFSESSLKKLKNFYSIGSKALDDYNNKLMESQAVYQNQQSGGWLTKFAYWTNPATWIQKLTGIEGKWADAIALAGSGLFGMEAQMGQLGIWLTQHANKDVYDYEEGFTAAIANLRIETRERSKGFLGTGIGGHAQETDDLVEWVKRELGLDLFDNDYMLNEEAYKVLMDKYADKLVGETKATLEALYELQEKWNEYIEQLQDYVDSLYSPLVDNMADALWSWYDEGKNALTSFREYASDTFRSIVTDMMKTIILSKFAEEYANDIKDLYTNYAKGGISEEQLITAVADRTGQMMEEFNQSMPVLESLMNTAGDVLEKYGISLRKGSGAELSQLQQGIQSITESTANSIEAYMNILNQRVFYHGAILEQIRDAVVTMSFDVQLSIFSQMLLQLQNNYMVMQSMQSMMENWTIPSGSGIRVELVS